MKRVAAEEYLERAKLLTKEEVEHLFARMRGKLARRLEDRRLEPLEAVAIQLEVEDEQLKEWRQRWSEINGRDKKHRDKGD